MTGESVLVDELLSFADLTFGQRIVELRNRAGITQIQLAHRMHVSQTAVRDWEHDRSKIKQQRISQLCRVLKCRRSELL